MIQDNNLSFIASSVGLIVHIAAMITPVNVEDTSARKQMAQPGLAYFYGRHF